MLSGNILVALLLVAFVTSEICDKLCDGNAAYAALNPRMVYKGEMYSRELSIFVSDEDNVAYGSISHGSPGDEVWIDRSWNGGRTWSDGSHLVAIDIPADSDNVLTSVVNIDGNFSSGQIGVVRACGKVRFTEGVMCTAWTRARAHSSSPAEAAATALMMDYKDNGQWESVHSWQNAPNCLGSIIDYMIASDDKTFKYAINITYERNKKAYQGNFREENLDTSGFWGLTWISAYDLTGKKKYLRTAQTIGEYMYAHRDFQCGGGVYSTNSRVDKTATVNEVFIKLAAALHNRIPDDTKFLERAIDVWEWFARSGLINYENLINSGLDVHCRNNEGTTWSHNQGIILGGLTELFKATDDTNYLDRARTIADAAVNSPLLNNRGVLHEPCDYGQDECGEYGHSFKGIFVRNLKELNEALDDRPYTDYLVKNANVTFENRNSINLGAGN